MEYSYSSQTCKEPSFVPKSLGLQVFIFGCLFIIAFGIRLYRVSEPPLDFHSTRQFHSAIIARDYYYKTLNSIPEWKKEVASINRELESVLEPPIMELITALYYRLAGGEYLWIPRLTSSIFWLIGGIFLYFLSRKISSVDAALVATAFYLFLPFSVIASRSFQPDPMMVMMMLGSIVTIVLYYERPSSWRLAAAIVVSSAAMFVKPVCMFPIFGSFLALSIEREGFRRAITNIHTMIFLAISVASVLVYYFYNIFIAEFWAIQHQSQTSFLPHLLLQPFFWKLWFKMINEVVGYAAFAGALLGILMLREGLPRALVVGLWASYFVFGVIFTYHIHTHNYYTLQFIPIVALSLGPLGAVVMEHLRRQTSNSWLLRIAIWCILVFLLLFNVYGLRNRLTHPQFEREAKKAKEIGEYVSHSTRTLILASDYGNSLKYYGELSGMPWMMTSDLRLFRLLGRREMNVEERFNELNAKYAPEYFIVTHMEEFQKQADLRMFLGERFPVLVQKDDYMILDLKRKR